LYFIQSALCKVIEKSLVSCLQEVKSLSTRG
jgi:hypothetical protein